MKKPHKHAELIKAWADGAEIEYSIEGSGNWLPCNAVVGWYTAYEYRIKPEPKPDVIYYGFFKETPDRISLDSFFEKNIGPNDQLKVTFDGETGKLKSAEVI